MVSTASVLEDYRLHTIDARTRDHRLAQITAALLRGTSVGPLWAAVIGPLWGVAAANLWGSVVAVSWCRTRCVDGWAVGRTTRKIDSGLHAGSYCVRIQRPYGRYSRSYPQQARLGPADTRFFRTRKAAIRYFDRQVAKHNKQQ